jgi:hypothetical protein
MEETNKIGLSQAYRGGTESDHIIKNAMPVKNPYCIRNEIRPLIEENKSVNQLYSKLGRNHGHTTYLKGRNYPRTSLCSMQDGLDGDQILNYIMDEGGGNIQLELVWEGGLRSQT